MLLAHLRAVATDADSARHLERIRREAETMPLSALASVAVRAMALADGMCWDSIARGRRSGVQPSGRRLCALVRVRRARACFADAAA
jgi:hypothetical protein